MPARCGVAIEVPWKNAQHGVVPVPVLHVQRGCELSTFTPGATTSGLTRKSTSVGPQLEKPAMMLLFGVWKYAFVAEMVVATPSLAFSRLPSLSETMYAGNGGLVRDSAEAHRRRVTTGVVHDEHRDRSRVLRVPDLLRERADTA